jgi:glycosyltransferase involved in cell wall biosynthesis
VDDGSSDNTDEVVGTYVQKDPRFQYHKRPDTHKPGGNGARNYGFEVSMGEYVNWFDDDDLMLENKLQIQVLALQNSEFNFSVCQTLVFEENKNSILGLRHKKIVSENTLFDFIKLDIVFLTQAPIFKRSFLIKNNLYYYEKLKAAQEWEFICRVLYYSPIYKVEFLPLVLIRKHKESISNNNNKTLRKQNYYLARTKVFKFLLKKNVLESNQEMKDFFRDYFVSNFKVLLFKNKKKGMFLFINSFIYLNNFKDNIKLFLYITFVILTGRGYTFRDRFIK